MTSKTASKAKTLFGKRKPTAMQSIEQEGLDSKVSADADALKGKIGGVLKLVRRETGASIEELRRATGWQSHSVRGAVSGTLRRRLGLTVERIKVDGITCYRVTA